VNRPAGRLVAAVFLFVTSIPLGAPEAVRAGAPPARGPGDVVPVASLRARLAAPRIYTTGDTVTVFTDSLESLTSPGAEGGWTHLDKSGTPTAWQIASAFACQGPSFWCGIVDSSWTGDPDRKGYGNGWTQEASNFVDLTGAIPPVRMGFRHHLNVEAGFDIARVEVLDDQDGWIVLASYSGVVDPSGAALCDTVTFTIPHSIVTSTPILPFRLTFDSDVSGSSEDGLYAAAAGWSIANLTV
jgi:hypothetical protein